MSAVGDLRDLLRGEQFRRLFVVRVTSQCGDGIFQVGLASYVLFSPERQPDAAAIAWALAAVLLPFSLLGPFAGVFLDRWNRRQTLAVGNVLRTVPVLASGAIIAGSGPDIALFATAVGAFSANRFLLAGLSAALPRVVPRHELVLANSVTPTSGTVAFMVGLGVASLLQRVPWGVDTDVVTTVLAAGVYLCAAGLAMRIPRAMLGPDLELGYADVRRELRQVATGLVAGVRHLRSRPVAAAALGCVAAHRFFYGLSAVATILLYRNYFNEPSDADAGLAGLSVAVLVSGLGILSAAIVTPVAAARLSTRGWMLTLLALAAGFEVFPGALYTVPGLLVAAFALGLSAQGVKICVDTLVQTHVDDAFRGRVFSLYDVVFNVVFVAAAATGAAVIPADGKSYPVLAGVAVGYTLTGVWYASVTRPLAAAAPQL